MRCVIVGRGLYSFKGSGYVRGGIFDRIVLIQDDVSVRFRDKMHKRLGAVAAEGAPEFTETDLFKIPADVGFDPTKPFRIQLLVHREVGPIEKVFTTFDLGYQLPEKYLRAVAPPPAAEVPDAVAEVTTQDETAAHQALWKRIWADKQLEIAVTAGDAGRADAGVLLPGPGHPQCPRLLLVPHGVPDRDAGLSGLVCQCAAVGREPDGAFRGAGQRVSAGRPSFWTR